MNILDLIFEKFFDADPDPGWKKSVPGSEINIPDPRHWPPESHLSLISEINKHIYRTYEISKKTRLDDTVDNPEGGPAIRSSRDVAQVPGVSITFPILRGSVANLPT
jgi:hypothetical protein